MLALRVFVAKQERLRATATQEGRTPVDSGSGGSGVRP
jgi:hypothetical protein